MVVFRKIKSGHKEVYKQHDPSQVITWLAEENDEYERKNGKKIREKERKFKEMKNNPEIQERRQNYIDTVVAERKQKSEEARVRREQEQKLVEERRVLRKEKILQKSEDLERRYQAYLEDFKKDAHLFGEKYAEIPEDKDLFKKVLSECPETLIWINNPKIIFDYNFVKNNAVTFFKNFDLIKENFGTIKVVKFFNYIYRKDELFYEDILEKLTSLDNKNIMPYYLWGSVCESNGYIKLELFDELLSESDKDLLFRNDEFVTYNHDRLLSHYPVIFKSLSRETIEGNMRFVDFFNERYYSSSETQKIKLQKLWEEKVPTLVLGGQDEIQKSELSEQERIERDIEDYRKYQSKINRVKSARYKESRTK